MMFIISRFSCFSLSLARLSQQHFPPNILSSPSTSRYCFYGCFLFPFSRLSLDLAAYIHCICVQHRLPRARDLPLDQGFIHIVYTLPTTAILIHPVLYLLPKVFQVCYAFAGRHVFPPHQHLYWVWCISIFLLTQADRLDNPQAGCERRTKTEHTGKVVIVVVDDDDIQRDREHKSGHTVRTQDDVGRFIP